MKTLTTFKASPLHNNDEELPDAVLQISRSTRNAVDEMSAQMKANGTYEHFFDAASRMYQDEAKAVVDFLLSTMPQGLTDRIAGELMLRKASLFVIAQKEVKNDAS